MPEALAVVEAVTMEVVVEHATDLAPSNAAKLVADEVEVAVEDTVVVPHTEVEVVVEWAMEVDQVDTRDSNHFE